MPYRGASHQCNYVPVQSDLRNSLPATQLHPRHAVRFDTPAAIHRESPVPERLPAVDTSKSLD